MMSSNEFVAGIRKEVLDTNLQIYRQMFAESDANRATDPYGRQALQLYASLDDVGRQRLFMIIRQTIVDTISSIFAILDGVTRLRQQPDDLILELSGRKLNGSLQDLFLEMEEERPSGQAPEGGAGSL